MSNQDQSAGTRNTITTGITPASQSQYEGYQGTELPPGTVVPRRERDEPKADDWDDE